MSGVPSAVTLCSGTATSIALSSTPAADSYSWTSVSTGATGSAGTGTGSTIAETLTSTSTAGGTVVYSITPTIDACSSVTPYDVTVTVSPEIDMSGVPSAVTLCSGTATSIALSSTPAADSYSWTSVSTGVTGSAGTGTGSTIAETLTATSTTGGTVVYSVTPTIGACSSVTPYDVTVTVSPEIRSEEHTSELQSR